MHVGHKLKQEKVTRYLARLVPSLRNGEEILFMGVCNNLRPMVDRLMVTNERLMVGSSVDHIIRWESRHASLLDVIFDAKKKTVTVHTTDGGRQVFKMVPAEDHEVIRRTLDAQRESALAGTGLAVAVRDREAPLTPAQEQAIAEGFPSRHRHLVEPVLAHLEEAVAAAERGDILAEERAIWEGRRLANKAGLAALRGPLWFESRVMDLARRNLVRRGVDLIGTVAADLIVMSDRCVQKDRTYILDADVRASVEVDGQILKSSRPTLTRMAFGSVLPGSALLVGLALPKTTTEDKRRARFVLAHPQWRVEERLDPDHAHLVVGIAAQVNAVAEGLKRQQTVSFVAAAREVPPAAPASASAHGLAEEMTKLASLRDAGILTEEEFTAAKARLLA